VLTLATAIADSLAGCQLFSSRSSSRPEQRTKLELGAATFTGRCNVGSAFGNGSCRRRFCRHRKESRSTWPDPVQRLGRGRLARRLLPSDRPWPGQRLAVSRRNADCAWVASGWPGAPPEENAITMTATWLPLVTRRYRCPPVIGFTLRTYNRPGRFYHNCSEGRTRAFCAE
jgi:hypothetical protein